MTLPPDPTPPPRSFWTPVVTALTVAALCAFAFWLRALYSRDALMAGGEVVHNLDPDIHMQLRRLEMQDALGGLGASDPFVNCPDAFRAAWPVALQQLTLVLRALAFAPDHRGLLDAANALPALVGALAVGVTILGLRRRVSLPAALCGGLVVAVVRPALSVTGYGFYDHHCLELLVALGLPLVFVDGRCAPLAALAWAACLLAGDGTFVVAGAAVVVALAALVRFPHRLDAAQSRRRVTSNLAALAGGALASWVELGLDLPRALPHSGRIGLLALALGLSLAAMSGRRARAVGGVMAAIGLAFCAPLVLTAGGYLTASADPISPMIDQSRPLWAADPLALVPALVALGVTAYVAWRRRDRAEDTLALVTALAGGTLGIVQTKYAFLGVPAIALTVAAVAEAVLRRAGAARWGALAVGLGALALGAGRTATEVDEAPAGVDAADLEFAAVAAALRDRSPVQLTLGPELHADYGVLARPDQGPRLLRLAGRAVTAVPFWLDGTQRGHFLGALRALMARDEGDALAFMDASRLRYVLVEDLRDLAEQAVRAVGDLHYEEGVVDRGLAYQQALWARLFAVDGSEAESAEAGSDGAKVHLEALHCFRWVSGSPRYRVFERVAGAKLIGRAPPGARIVVDLAVTTPERPIRYRASTTSDAEGRFAIVVPYATEDVAPGGHAVAARLTCPSGARPLEIPEAAVVGGQAVPADCPSE